jgi:hypothetical protein
MFSGNAAKPRNAGWELSNMAMNPGSISTPAYAAGLWRRYGTDELCEETTWWPRAGLKRSLSAAGEIYVREFGAIQRPSLSGSVWTAAG